MKYWYQVSALRASGIRYQVLDSISGAAKYEYAKKQLLYQKTYFLKNNL
jgi:hypothetical protein